MLCERQHSVHSNARAAGGYSGGPSTIRAMTLPLAPPVAPQLAKSARDLPVGDGWIYEPKWDGFRVIAFVDGDDVYLQSRGSRPLSRYFPEIVPPRGRYVLDGEIVVLDADGQPDFEHLQHRLHPAASRVQRLAAEIPATLIAFDLLAEGDEDLCGLPFAERRARLPAIGDGALRLTESTTDPAQAGVWLDTIEGVIAKELAAPYRPGKRLGMVKVKKVRTLDCVVVGYREGIDEGTVGSLILGMHRPSGELMVVGHSSGFGAKQKRDLLAVVRPYESGDRGTADPSRWSGGRELEWVGLRPELVVEVAFDHASSGRIRHGARLLRFRDDKAPAECVMEGENPFA
jgi:ATP-dependent DNA ligase